MNVRIQINRILCSWTICTFPQAPMNDRLVALQVIQSGVALRAIRAVVFHLPVSVHVPEEVLRPAQFLIAFWAADNFGYAFRFYQTRFGGLSRFTYLRESSYSTMGYMARLCGSSSQRVGSYFDPHRCMHPAVLVHLPI